MKKGVIIIAFSFVLFLIEFLVFNIFGSVFMPNLLLLLVIFINLYLGIRYSIFAAICAGLLKDSFFVGGFGVNLVSFILCAYMVTFLKRYIYHAGSRFSRLLLVFILVIIHVAVNYVLLIKYGTVDFVETLKFVLIPELITTVLIATTVFQYLKKCALKLSE